jgi:hypothetical protein
MWRVVVEAHRVLVGKPERKRPTDRPRCRWKNNIRMYLQVKNWESTGGLG